MHRLVLLLMTAALVTPAWATPALAAPPPHTPPAITPPIDTPAPPTASLVHAGITEHLTPHVWAIPDDSSPGVPNVGIIIGSKSLLVIDTGMGARNADTIMGEINKIPEAKGKALYIVSTHFHPEHDLAAHAFPAGSKMIRAKDEEADIAQYGLALANTFASRSTVNAELLKGVNFRPADISFDKDYRLDLGGVQVHMVSVGPNHTRGDTVFFIEGDKVLFTGDVAMRAQPAFAAPESSLNHWLGALDRLDAFKPVHVVPSHGPRGDETLISGYRAYLIAVRDKTRAAKTAGKTQDETVAAVTADLIGQYPDKGRLDGAIRNAWKEAA
jgi:glyoxylase-like metal-dependent hydrolase (beta-lactamase superfamily II)